MRRDGIAAVLVLLAGLAASGPATADHPGADLDRAMGEKEKYFQEVDRPAPEFALSDAEGREVQLSDFADKVVVLHFIYASCPDICPLHAEAIAEVQSLINETPMRDRVQFISITTDPANDGPEVLRGYGPVHGLDSANWSFLTIGPGMPEDATRKLAEAYGHGFHKMDGGYQVHSAVTHVIDREGRWAANFHGLKFKPLNLVMYVNGLTNNDHAGHEDESWWRKLLEIF